MWKEIAFKVEEPTVDSHLAYYSFYENTDDNTQVIYASIYKKGDKYKYWMTDNHDYIHMVLPKKRTYDTYDECKKEMLSFISSIKKLPSLCGMTINETNETLHCIWEKLMIDKEYPVYGFTF